MSTLWNGKKIIFTVTTLFSILSVIYALSLPNIYRSEAILVPSLSSSEISGASRTSSLAGIVGFPMLNGGRVDKVTESIEFLKSFNFFEGVVKKYDLLVPIVAVNDWNKDKNQMIIDENFYNQKDKEWVSEIEYSINGKPTMQYAHRKFINENLRVSKDFETGLVTMSIDHYSPYFAKDFLEVLIKEINEIQRTEDIARSEKSIEYLENEISGTQLSEIRNVLSALVQNQTETIMLAKSTPEYVLKIASAPIAPEEKSSPSRATICILFFLFGFSLSCLYVLMRHFYKE